MKNCKTNAQGVTRTMPLVASIAALGMAFTFALPHAAYAQGVTPPTVPDSIRVPSGNVAFLLGRGVGTQNYVCQPADSLGRVAWTLFTPEATLFSDEEDQLTTHFFSPNPDEPGIVTRHLGGLPGYEHRMGEGDRFYPGPDRGGRDSLGEAANGWNSGRTDRRQHALRNDIHPAGTYGRRIRARDKL